MERFRDCSTRQDVNRIYVRELQAILAEDTRRFDQQMASRAPGERPNVPPGLFPFTTQAIRQLDAERERAFAALPRNEGFINDITECIGRFCPIFSQRDPRQLDIEQMEQYSSELRGQQRHAAVRSDREQRAQAQRHQAQNEIMRRNQERMVPNTRARVLGQESDDCNGEYMNCPVCVSEMGPGEEVIRCGRCSAWFHNTNNCTKWAREKNQCPICRARWNGTNHPIKLGPICLNEDEPMRMDRGGKRKMKNCKKSYKKKKATTRKRRNTKRMRR